VGHPPIVDGTPRFLVYSSNDRHARSVPSLTFAVTRYPALEDYPAMLSTLKTATTIILSMLLGAAIVRSDGTPTASVSAMREMALQDEAVIRVYETVGASVVNITSSARGFDESGRAFRQEGSGSGFIVDRLGHVVTNHHVVSGASRVDITLADQSVYIGEVVGLDPANDIAVLKMQAPQEKLAQLTVAPLGDSNSLRVGQSVVAIGNPFGLGRSATLGIVSSVGRARPGETSRLITNMVQTDAAINPGNSGGPLINLRGEVIGINEQIEAPSRGNVGVGFATPVNTLKRYLPQLIAGVQPDHAWFGVSGVQLTPTLAEELELPVSQGALLTRLAPGGPAERAGLQGGSREKPGAGDIVTELAGSPIRSVEDIAVIVDQHEPGDVVHVRYVRGGNALEATVTLDAWTPQIGGR
jgi:S1-C subfamily serine protease